MSGPPAAGPQPTSPVTELVLFQEGQTDPSVQWLAPKIGDATFLGYKKSEGEPFNDIKIGYNDQDFSSEGFSKATPDLNPQGTKRVFVWVKKGDKEGASPIIQIKLMTSDEQFAGAGFTKLSAPLNPGKSGGRVPRIHLCFKTLAAHRKHEERNWGVGDKMDALDTSNSWLVGKVMKTKGEGDATEYFINYVGWPHRWDEWFPKNSPRLLPLGVRTQGRWTGQDPRPPFNLGENMEKLREIVAKCKDIDKELKDGKGFDDDSYHFLTKGENREMLENVLGAEVEDPDEQLPVIQDYLQTNLRIIAKYLTGKEVDGRVLIGLQQIFGGGNLDHRFYMHQGVTGKEKPQSKKYVKRIKKEKENEVHSVYLIDNINYFGDLGGFDHIGKRLVANSEEKGVFTDSFAVVEQLVASLSVIRFLYNPDFAKVYIKNLQLQKLCARSLQRMTDEELKTLDKDAFNVLLQNVKALLGVISKEKEVDEFSERIQLDISLRLLSADVLRKRIDALSSIENIIKSVLMASNPAFAKKEQERLEEEARNQYSYYMRRQEPPKLEKARFLTPEYLVNWIKETKLVETVLGKKSHEQLVKMSPTILKFLAQNHALTDEHLALLWSHINGGHDSLRRIVYEALAELAEEMNEKQVESLYAKMSSLDLKEYKDFNLTFLKNFTINAVKATQGKGKWFGLDIFWKILQDENAQHLEKDVVSQAFICFRDMLQGKLFESQRGVYLEQCINGLKTGKSVVICLRLAPVIIELSEQHAEKLIQDLDKKYQIMDLLLDDATRYAESAKKVAGSRKDIDESKGSPVLVGIHTHYEHLWQRLSFLEFLVSNSSKLQLAKAHINALWSVFVTNAVFPGDTTLLLNWLTQAVSNRPKEREGKEVVKKSDTLNPEMAQYVFTLLCQVQVEKMTKQWFESFQTYFIELNNRIKSLKNPNAVWLVITDFQKLQGRQALWNFAHRSTDPQVSQAARHFLTTIHIRLDSSLKSEEKRNIYGSFVQNCMGLLSNNYTAVKENKDGKNRDVTLKALSEVVQLLSTFLTRMESGEASKRPLFQSGEKIAAFWKTQRPKRYSATVEDVNPDLSYKVRYDDGDFDPKCPEENMFTPDGQVKRAVKTASDEEDELYPKKFLATQKEYFELFFSLLGLGGETADRVWVLLRYLPINKDLEERVLGLAKQESIDWKAVLPTESITKLLYTLQTVKNNILNDETGRPRSASPVAGQPHLTIDVKVPDHVKAWNSMFLSKGGFKHLYDFLMKTPQEELLKGVLPQQCMALVMTILKHFLGGSLEVLGVDNKIANDMVDYPALIDRLLRVVNASIELKAEDEDGAKVHGDLINVTFSLLIHASTRNEKYMATVLGFPKWEHVVIQGLTRNQNGHFRKELSEGLHKFAFRAEAAGYEGKKNPRSLFLPFLLSRLEHIDTSSHETPCGEYFSTLGHFIKQSVVLDFDSKALSAHLNKLLRSHPILEAHEKEIDHVLVELLTLTLQLVIKVPELRELLGASSGKEGLLQNIVDSLFEMPAELSSFSYSESGATGGNSPPKCKSPQSRAAAFKLLAEMCKDNVTNALRVASLLEPNHFVSHSGKLNPGTWDFVPAEKAVKSKSIGYVGLRNLGCICYMNASMQQLFMIPRLRHNILSIENYKNEDLRQDIVFQLQYIFSHLQETEKQQVDPKPFTDIWMDETGKKPINVGKQEDASAFVIRLIDRIDDSVKGTPNRDCFREVLGGIFEHQLIGMGDCPHSRISRDEEFFTIPLEVKNKKSVIDALKAFVEGEIVEGFNCEGCKRKVSLKKRAVVKRLPPVLILTLKRFVLNFQTFNTEKLDDRMEFPDDLDMYPFTAEALPIPKSEAQEAKSEGKAAEGKAAEGKGAEGKGAEGKGAEGKGAEGKAESKGAEGKAAESKAAEAEKPPEKEYPRTPEYYKYVLRGVVIHTGTAHSGHYYSFIQERLVSNDPTEPMQAGKWFKFNDTRVTKFDPKEIPDQCFGGTNPRASRGFGGVANGYLLFYDCIDPNRHVPSKEIKEGDAKEELSPKVKPKKLDLQRARAKVPTKIYQDIWQQNLTYWRDKSVFDDQYFEFLLKLADDVKGSDADVKSLAEVDLVKPVGMRDAITRLSTRFYFMTLSRSKNKDTLHHWIPIFRRLYHNNISSSAWFLNTFCQPKTSWVADFLLECPEEAPRAGAVEIVTAALSTLCPLEQSSFAGDIKVPDGKEMKEIKDRPVYSSYNVYDPPELDKDIFIPGQSAFEEKRLDERGYVVTLIDHMIYYLKHTVRFWKTWSGYYAVLAHFVRLGRAEAAYAQKHELIGKLLDIYLKDQSPHPELNGIPAAQGRRIWPLRQQNIVPDFTHFLRLLRALVLSTPFGQHTQIAREMLTATVFVTSLFTEASTAQKGHEVNAIIQYLAYDPACSEGILKLLGGALQALSHEQIRPHLRVMAGLLDMKDDHQPARTNGLLDLVLRTMEAQRGFYKETDMMADHLIRWAKHQHVRQWLNANGARLDWLIQWLKDNPKPSLENKEMKLEKERGEGGALHQDKWETLIQTTKYSHYGIDPAIKVAILEAIKAGSYGAIDQDNRDVGYDSDEVLHTRRIQPGLEIDCVDTDLNWLKAKVVEVDNNNQRAFINYDGWQDKWNEWIYWSSPRIAERNRFTQFNPPKKKRNQQA